MLTLNWPKFAILSYTYPLIPLLFNKEWSGQYCRILVRSISTICLSEIAMNAPITRVICKSVFPDFFYKCINCHDSTALFLLQVFSINCPISQSRSLATTRHFIFKRNTIFFSDLFNVS